MPAIREIWARLDAAGRPSRGFPGHFLGSNGVRSLIFADTWQSLVTWGRRGVSASA